MTPNECSLELNLLLGEGFRERSINNLVWFNNLIIDNLKFMNPFFFFFFATLFLYRHLYLHCFGDSLVNFLLLAF